MSNKMLNVVKVAVVLVVVALVGVIPTQALAEVKYRRELTHIEQVAQSIDTETDNIYRFQAEVYEGLAADCADDVQFYSDLLKSCRADLAELVCEARALDIAVDDQLAAHEQRMTCLATLVAEFEAMKRKLLANVDFLADDLDNCSELAEVAKLATDDVLSKLLERLTRVFSGELISRAHLRPETIARLDREIQAVLALLTQIKQARDQEDYETMSRLFDQLEIDYEMLDTIKGKARELGLSTEVDEHMTQFYIQRLPLIELD